MQNKSKTKYEAFICFRVNDKIKTQFQEVCKIQKTTPSKHLREFVLDEIKNKNIGVVP